MKINVRYFARVREALGPGEALNFADDGGTGVPYTVGELREWLAARSPAHAEVLAPSRGLRAAFNQDMCPPDQPLSDGGEVAFFPPVTGG